MAENDTSRSSRRTFQPGYAPSSGSSAPLPTLASPEPEEESPAPRVAARQQRGRTPAPAPRVARSTDDAAREALREADEMLGDLAESEQDGSGAAGEPIPARGGTPAALPRMTVDELDLPTVSSNPDEFVVTRRSPELRLETSGPRRLLVGRPAKYKVAVYNAGEAPATDVVVLVELPDWAEVVGTEATSGNAQPATEGAAGAFRWTVPQIKARGKQELKLEIVARQDRPFELGVSWTSAPAEAIAKIEVRQAKLMLALSGPKEVSYGEKSIFKLTFSNPGTADAENVVVKLLPLDAESDAAETHTLGSLAAGATKEVELELVARQQGQLKVNIEATADGDLKATVSEEVLVRRAGLQVALEAPKFQYSGALAAYKLTVTNPGDEPAKNVRVTASLPRGATFVSNSADGVYDEAAGQVAWDLKTMQPGQEETLLLRCNLEMSGPNQLVVKAAADGELTASVEEATQVEATADLSLEVRDPGGPMPVDQEVVYEIVVRNRGAKAATDIEVVGFFSNGIDPVKVEGSEYTIEDGKVLLTPIASLAAGDERIFKIRARAHFRGNHIFRAEVHCHSPDSALAQEGTTRYYAADEDPHAAPAENAAPAEEAADTTDADAAVAPDETGEPTETAPETAEEAGEPMEAAAESDEPVAAEETPIEAEVAPDEAAPAAPPSEAPQPQRLGWRPRRQPTPAVELTPAGDGAADEGE